MVALHDFAAMIQRRCLFVMLVLVATTCRSISAQNISTDVESRETKTSVWWPVVECVLLDDVNKCLQDRSVRAFVGLDLKEDIRIDTEKETVKMPGEQEEGIFEMLGDLVTDGIRRIFQNDDKKDEDDEDDEEEDYEEGTHEAQQAESGDSYKVGDGNSSAVAVEGDAQRTLETGRTKKKIKKLIHLIKIIVVVVLISLKIVKLLYVFGKLLEFKMVVLVGINTLINLVRLFLDWKKGKDPHNVVHYEEAHHEHIHDGSHFDSGDKGWLGGLWSRSHLNGARSLTHPHDLAYSAQKPLPQ